MHHTVRRSRLVRAVWAAAACALAAGGPLAAQDARRGAADLLDEGNAELESGHYETALETYDRAAEALPDSPEIAYNRGLALYRLGRFEEAQAAFQDALRPGRPDIEARAKFNLGRNAHESAMKKQEQDVQSAVNDLTKAIGFYRDAEQLAPQDADARTNREAAERLRRYLEYLMQQEQQQQQQQENEEQHSTSQPDSSPTSQPNPSPQSQPSSQPDEQPQEQGDEEPEQGEQQDEQGRQDQDDGRSDSDQDAEADGDEPSDQKEANKSKDENQPQRQLKEEQVEPMLQEARDMERRRREARREQMMRMRGRIPVKKDW
jgi:tetratricopeptide (TPR) repeat protein